jgi:hypothetical protein
VRHSTPLVSVITRKGGKVVTIPLAPRTARAIDLAIGERAGGPVFLAGDGRRLDRHGAGRIVRKVARRTGIGKAVTPHTLRHAFITAARSWMPGYRCGTCKRRRRPRTTIRQSGPAAAWTGTRPTSWPPTSRVPPGNPRGLGLFRLAAMAVRRKVPAVFGHEPRPQPEREPPICAISPILLWPTRTMQIRLFCVVARRRGRSGRNDDAGAGLPLDQAGDLVVVVPADPDDIAVDEA